MKMVEFRLNVCLVKRISDESQDKNEEVVARAGTRALLLTPAGTPINFVYAWRGQSNTRCSGWLILVGGEVLVLWNYRYVNSTGLTPTPWDLEWVKLISY